MIDIKLFCKGLLMGIADLVPGISGGTIAFITGIYATLMSNIRALASKQGVLFVLSSIARPRSRKKQNTDQNIDLAFLLTLFTGVVIALLLFSRVMSFLLETYFVFVMAFFIGLILASSKIIFDHIERHHTTNVLFALIGLCIGVAIAFIAPQAGIQSLWYIALSGFLAISALFLPGISGSYVLIILGSYEFMLGVLHNLFDNLIWLLAFGVGAIVGAIMISRVVTFLFERDKCKTLYVLLGLVTGSLVLPVRSVFAAAQGESILGLLAISLLFVIGFLSVMVLSALATQHRPVKSSR